MIVIEITEMECLRKLKKMLKTTHFGQLEK